MFRKIFSIFLCFLIVTPDSFFADEKEKYTIAILDLEANGVSNREARSISNILRTCFVQMVKSKKYTKSSNIKYTVVDRSQMDKIFEQFDIQNTGCTYMSCAIEFGKMLSAERVIIGSIGLVGDTYIINASIVDVETAAIMAVAYDKYEGSIKNLLEYSIPNVINETIA